MKKYLSIVLLALTINSSFAVENNPIVDVNVVEEFGIWRVYNSGDEIYVVDSIKGRIITAGDYINGGFQYYLPEGDVYVYSSFSSGTTSISSASYPNSEFKTATETIAPTAHLQNGLFNFEEISFQIDGDTMIIYDKKNYNEATKEASLKMVLNKYSNRVLVEGPENTNNFEPTDVVGPGDIAGPAKILGDCNANYNPATGILSIPCFSMGNDRTVHQINLNQIPGTVDFSADLDTFIRVQ
ncbi:MAG: hypothetical protein L3J59_07880 [Methylococcaceae bacterium]|nr:hypothetical protein [Methylococcaceae bacterium]